MSDHIFDYSKVTDKIIVGSDLCLGRNCKDHAEEFDKLNVGCEISLTKEKKETPPKDLNYTWIPVADNEPPSDAQLDLGTSLINKAVEAKKNIYVHCKNGHGRSPTLVAAYLVRFKGMGVEEAIELIKKKRPEIHLSESQIESLEKNRKRWLK